MIRTVIAYADIAAQHDSLKRELLEAAERVMKHGQFILGPEVSQFEEQFAATCGTAHAVGVNSGTDAIILALRALGIGAGDEVITQPNSFIATAAAITMAGARPVFVDVREDYNIDPERIEEAVTERTRAVLPVHLTGRPADMDPILDVARKHHLHVVEDAAQAVTAEYQGRRVGGLGIMGCFSLHPLKTLNACGDGGVITTNDTALYKKLLALRNLGLVSREQAVVWSDHSRLDTLQAAFLLVKLRHLERWTEARRAHARIYQEELSLVSAVEVPRDRDCERAVYHTFVLQAEQRDTLRAHLAEQGIATVIHYPVPIHLQEAARHLGYREGDFPLAERQARRILTLPVYPELGENAVCLVASAIKTFYAV